MDIDLPAASKVAEVQLGPRSQIDPVTTWLNAVSRSAHTRHAYLREVRRFFACYERRAYPAYTLIPVQARELLEFLQSHPAEAIAPTVAAFTQGSP